MKTNVYVDAFNLYYGCLKGTPYRWLNIEALCQAEFPANTINRIRCFTARVSARPGDPDQRNRQNAYLRALDTLPNLSIHYGQFRETEVRMRTVSPPPNTVLVKKTEEKGSDVNLASYLLLDGFRHDYEAAIVITNDSDLVEPIRIVRKELGLKVVALIPCGPTGRPSIEIRRVASKSKIIGLSNLPLCQFAPTLTDANGTITKPSTW